MTSKLQFSLFPKSSDHRWSLLHGLEPISCELSNLANCVEAQISDLVFLEVSPDCLNRVELRGIGRQACNRNMSVQLFEPGGDFAAAVQKGQNKQKERNKKGTDLFTHNLADGGIKNKSVPFFQSF